MTVSFRVGIGLAFEGCSCGVDDLACVRAVGVRLIGGEGHFRRLLVRCVVRAGEGQRCAAGELVARVFQLIIMDTKAVNTTAIW